MLQEIFLAVVQAATEFLPISSSGHLALFSNLMSQPNVFFFTALHIASLIAVIIFTRREIALLFTFSRDARRLWGYLIIATIPAALFGLLFKDFIESAFSSYLFLSMAFLITGIVLLMTKNTKITSKLNSKNAFLIGLFQVLALFPGVSRSGMTISAGLFSGIPKERAVKFSFLLFIPLSMGAFALEAGQFYYSHTLLLSFLITLFLSIFFLNLLFKIIKEDKFWMFSFYCFIVSLISLMLYFLL